MELLLLLTAFFASLTGATPDGAVRGVQGVAVVRAAEVAQAAVQPARAALPQVAVPTKVRPAAQRWFALLPAPIQSIRLVFERRLE